VRLGLTLIVTILGLAWSALAERYSLTADPNTEEGRYLQLIGLQSTVVERIALLERFVRRHPEHPSIPWVYEQLQIAYLEAGQFDKTIATGEKLLEICPDDLEAARRNQKAAESGGIRELVDRWTTCVAQIARKIADSPEPKDPHALEIWKEAVAAASRSEAQSEYSLLQRAEAATSPAEQVRLLDELRQRNPGAAYLNRIWALYLRAYRAQGDHKQALPYAEKILANDKDNEDALMGAAEGYFESRSPKAIQYATRLIHVMQTKSRPPEVREEDWTKQRAAYTGSASWIAGATYIGQNQFGEAERMLRQALSAFKESDARVAPVLFYLGWANYKLANRSEALRYYKQCSGIKSEFQEQASKNLDAVAGEISRSADKR
jgi:tetratricopeptide (TPR) repeat protein